MRVCFNKMDRRGRETGRLQSEITRRLDEFQRRGLLSEKMTEHYKMSIVKARSNPITYKPYLERIQGDLDRINDEGDQEKSPSPPPAKPSPTSSTYSSGTSASVSAFTEIASAANSNASSAVRKYNNNNPMSMTSRPGYRKNVDESEMQRNEKASRWGNHSNASGQSELAQFFEKRNRQSLESKKVDVRLTHDSENHSDNIPANPVVETGGGFRRFDRGNRDVTSTSPMIVDVQDMAAEIEDEQMQELFVEMCFFARLGYVQPPCCLRCTYREALKDGNVQSQCPRWVIWRKDTNQLLHPYQLEGNLLMVQCRAAKKLLAGKTINGYAWSVERQEVFLSGS